MNRKQKSNEIDYLEIKELLEKQILNNSIYENDTPQELPALVFSKIFNVKVFSLFMIFFTFISWISLIALVICFSLFTFNQKEILFVLIIVCWSISFCLSWIIHMLLHTYIHFLSESNLINFYKLFDLKFSTFPKVKNFIGKSLDKLINLTLTYWWTIIPFLALIVLSILMGLFLLVFYIILFFANQLLIPLNSIKRCNVLLQKIKN